MLFIEFFLAVTLKCVVSSSPTLNNIINFKICYCRALVHIFAAGSKGNSSLSLKVLVVVAEVRVIVNGVIVSI